MMLKFVILVVLSYYCLHGVDLKNNCDLETGQCSCLPDASGRKCNECAPREVIDHNNLTCRSCDSCTTSLMDYLDEVSYNLNYANKTIEKARLSATIGFRLDELESTLTEHSVGSSKSINMFNSALNAIQQLTASEDVMNFIHKLENDSTAIESEITQLFNLPEEHSVLNMLMSNLSSLSSIFQEQLNSIIATHEELELTEQYHESSPVGTFNELFEIDNRCIEKLVKQSGSILKIQSSTGTKLKQIAQSLHSILQHIDDLSKRSKILFDNDGSEKLFHLNTLTQDLNNSISNSRETLDKLRKFRRIIESNNSIVDMTSLLKSSQSSLHLVEIEFNKSSKMLIESMAQLTDIRSIDTNLAIIADLTSELTHKTSNLTHWMTSDLKVKEKELTDQTNRMKNDFRNQTDAWNWKASLALASSIDETLDQLNMINESLTNVDKAVTVNSASRLDEFKNILNETKLMRSGILNGLEARFSDIRKGILSYVVGIERKKSDLTLLNHSVEAMVDSRQIPAALSSMDILLNETTETTHDVSVEIERVSSVSEKFSASWDEILRLTKKHSKFEYQSLMDDNRLLDYLRASKETERPSLMSASKQFDFLKDGFANLTDFQRLIRLSRIAGVEMRQSIESLQEKIDNARSMLRQVKLGRNSNGGGSWDECVKLRNPRDLGECCSTYNSISLLVKPNDKPDGVILFIGTPTSDYDIPSGGINNRSTEWKRMRISGVSDRNPPDKPSSLRSWPGSTYLANFSLPIEMQNSTSSFALANTFFQTNISKPEKVDPSLRPFYSEYLAVEMRKRRIAVILCLGSQIVEEVEDDVVLSSGVWHHIGIVRIGTLLSISVRSRQSSSSLTRSLSSPHTVLDLDSTRSVIFLACSPRDFTSSIPSGKLANETLNTTTTVDTSRSLPKGLRTGFGFSGQLSDLRLNEHKLGLWDTVQHPPIQTSVYLDTNSSTNIRIEWPKQSEKGHNGRACVPVNASQSDREPFRMVSFPRPRSNISSSFVQILNNNHELDELMLEDSEQMESSWDQASGHINKLTLRFKSHQGSGLLVHHSRPDHSSFMSIYISGGRLMLAVNFDKKIRFESHPQLADGRWHSLYLIVMRQNVAKPTDTNSRTGRQVRHNIWAILDDKYMFKDRFSALLELVNSSNLSQALSMRHENIAKPTAEVLSSIDPPTPASGPQAPDMLTTDRHLDSTRVHWEQLRKVLYFGGVEDKYIPLLRNQQIPTNFHGCIADVTINNIRLNFAQTNKNQGVLMNQCQTVVDR